MIGLRRGRAFSGGELGVIAGSGAILTIRKIPAAVRGGNRRGLLGGQQGVIAGGKAMQAIVDVARSPGCSHCRCFDRREFSLHASAITIETAGNIPLMCRGGRRIQFSFGQLFLIAVRSTVHAVLKIAFVQFTRDQGGFPCGELGGIAGATACLAGGNILTVFGDRNSTGVRRGERAVVALAKALKAIGDVSVLG